MVNSDIAAALHDLVAQTKIVYMYADEEVPDFTKHAPFSLVIMGRNQHKVTIPVERDTLPAILGMLDLNVFNTEVIETIVCWNIKSILSYFHAYIPHSQPPAGAIIDLHVIENWHNKNLERPTTLSDAIIRLKDCGSSWRMIYNKIHLPLMTKVIPSIEATPLLHVGVKDYVHGFYEIEGQANGRLRCAKKFSKSYLPHTLGPDDRRSLIPAYETFSFLYTDIRHCEVTVLAWLSDDPLLRSLIASGRDLHSEVYKAITGDNCDSDVKRKLSKKLFLPVMYGMGVNGLASAMNLSVDVARELVTRIQKKFPAAIEYLDAAYDKAHAGGVVEDYFGRPRAFQGDFYKSRNYVVQSVAATACLDRLIRIYNALPRESKLCFTVHDGYGLVVPKNDINAVSDVVKQIIHDESPLTPGLSLTSESRAGKTLDSLTIV